MYQGLGETGSLLGVYTNWADSAATEGSVPRVVESVYRSAETYGFVPVVGLGFQQDRGNGVTSTVAWSDSGQRARAIAAAVAVARAHTPELLALGVEVNRLYESDPAAFDGYVAGYSVMYDQVKAVSPGTLVFPVFELEMTKGKAYLMGGHRGPEWGLLDRFAGRMDAAAFTTYPFFDAESPSDLPSTYYAEIASHVSAPVIFTEVGWPSAPLRTAPTSGYGGSEAEQAAFVERFRQLTAGLDLRAALWAFPDDLNPDFANPAMTSVSLRTNGGARKPALATWSAWAAQPCGVGP